MMALAAQRPRAACPMCLGVCLNGSVLQLDVIMTVMQVQPPCMCVARDALRHK